MKYELQNNRIVNGLLKADLGLFTPDAVKLRLSQDVLILVDPTRASGDLWPCLWFLASILERQFFGNIFIRAKPSASLPAPTDLGPRCRFVPDGFAHNGLEIGLGISTSDDKRIWGDCRGGTITYRELADTVEQASPIACCALAGYLGFAALGEAAGVPPFHQTWTRSQVSLRLPKSMNLSAKEIGVLGLGQIGQAFLSLGFFLTPNGPIRVHLVDDDFFESENYRSQLLINEDATTWLDQSKTAVISQLCSRWGWAVTQERTRIDWGWKTPLSSSAVAFLGFDNMESRRVGVEGGFSWLVECGVGTDFLKPRVSWHTLPPSRTLAHQLFPEPAVQAPLPPIETEFLRQLDETPGGCGRVVYENIQATAPSLGALAAAFAWEELCNHFAGSTDVVAGGAYLWSPLQPIQRDLIPGDQQASRTHLAASLQPNTNVRNNSPEMLEKALDAAESGALPL